jgi:hypothetical protein
MIFESSIGKGKKEGRKEVDVVAQRETLRRRLSADHRSLIRLVSGFAHFLFLSVPYSGVSSFFSSPVMDDGTRLSFVLALLTMSFLHTCCPHSGTHTHTHTNSRFTRLDRFSFFAPHTLERPPSQLPYALRRYGIRREFWKQKATTLPTFWTRHRGYWGRHTPKRIHDDDDDAGDVNQTKPAGSTHNIDDR